jgi:hypothetical protein
VIEDIHRPPFTVRDDPTSSLSGDGIASPVALDALSTNSAIAEVVTKL